MRHPPRLWHLPQPFAPLLAAIFFSGLALVASAQGTGTAGATAAFAGNSGPDMSHVSPYTLNGFSLFGNFSDFLDGSDFQADWSGVGSPDFRLRAAYVTRRWTLEATVNQRAYFAGGDLAFAWNPSTGALDGRVPGVLQTYGPLAGSTVGRFDPRTLPLAKNLLPPSTESWVMRDFELALRSMGTDAGWSFSFFGSEREGTMPRTFVLATGFAPAVRSRG